MTRPHATLSGDALIAASPDVSDDTAGATFSDGSVNEPPPYILLSAVEVAGMPDEWWAMHQVYDDQFALSHASICMDSCWRPTGDVHLMFFDWNYTCNGDYLLTVKPKLSQASR